MKTEKIFAAIFFAGLLFKVLHWPGAGPLIVISATSLSMMYMGFAFYFFCDKKIINQNIFLSVISGILLSTVPVGLMFKLQYWPGAQLMMLCAIVTAPLVLLLVLVFKGKATDALQVYYSNMLRRSLILIVLAVVFFITPSSTLLKIQHWDEPELARLKALHYENPDNIEYENQYAIYKEIHNLLDEWTVKTKAEIVLQSDLTADNIIKEPGENNRIKERHFYKGHTFLNRIYKDGILNVEVHFSKDGAFELRKELWDNGIVAFEGIFYKGDAYGFSVWRFRNGDLNQIGTLFNNERISIWKEWGKDGQLVSEHNYENKDNLELMPILPK